MEIAHKTEFVTVSDGAKIALHSWVPKNFSGCVVHISHGMAEYALRYDSFARFLAEQGYTVFAHDHRGHGQSIQDSAPMGHLADKDGLWRVINDLKEIIEYTKKTYPESKYVLFAHSFGSFAAQVFITKYGSLINSLILSGTTSFMGGLGSLTRLLASVISIFSSVRNPSPFLTSIAFGSYNTKISKPSSPNAWLSRDEEEVKKYDESPLCGFPCTPGFYKDLGEAFTIMNKKANMKKIPKHITILLIAGTDDPVGGYGKQVKKLYDAYENLQFTSKIILYPQGRHESLNEINRDAVYTDILSWIKNYA
jgi:alpha-beta hydrolase superfamily lysophospholipase